MMKQPLIILSAILSLVLSYAADDVARNINSWLHLEGVRIALSVVWIRSGLLIAVVCCVFLYAMHLYKKKRSILWEANEDFLGMVGRNLRGKSDDGRDIEFDTDFRVLSFQYVGKNNTGRVISPDEIDAYIISHVTGARLDLILNGYVPKETNGIPPCCSFQLSVKFPNTTNDIEGMAFRDFWNTIGEFRFVFKTKFFSVEKVFTNKKIKTLFDGFVIRCDGKHAKARIVKR